MGSNFTIQVKGLDKVGQIFQNLPKTAQSQISDVMQEVGDAWVGAARTDAPANNSRLRGAVSRNIGTLSLEIIAQTEYAGYQEFGTKAKARIPAELQTYASTLQGAGRGGISPIDVLALWVKRKGLNAVTYNVKTRKKRFKNKDVAARSIAFLIFRKIKREGLKPQSFLFSSKSAAGTGDRLDYFVNQIKQKIAAVLQRIL